MSKIKWSLSRQVVTAFGPTYHREVSLELWKVVPMIRVDDIHRDYNGVGAHRYNSRDVGWNASGLTRREIERIINQIEPHIVRIIAGYDEVWNGNNYVGTFTNDADAANIEIFNIFECARYAK